MKSAGNDGSAGVTSPGMAYNITTVGGIDDRNTLLLSDDVLYAASSYCNISGMHNKPDLCAPAKEICTSAGTRSGTSYAAPQVTGAIALLCENKPALLVK